MTEQDKHTLEGVWNILYNDNVCVIYYCYSLYINAYSFIDTSENLVVLVRI